MPDVTGMSVDNAKKMLEASGFNVNVSEENSLISSTDSEDDSDEDSEETTAASNNKKSDSTSSSESSDSKTVYIQMPSGSTRVVSGTTVKIRAH